MAMLISGKEYFLAEEADWKSLNIGPGQIVEVALQTSSLGSYSEEWGAFMVSEAHLQEDGTLALAVQYLGATDPTEGTRIKDLFTADKGKLHLCGAYACPPAGAETAGTLHVVHIRGWDCADFLAAVDYLSSAEKRKAKTLHGTVVGPVQPKKPAPRRAPKVAKSKAVGADPRKKGEEDKGPPAPATPGAGVGPALAEEMKERLRQRLKTIRQSGVTGDNNGKEDPPEESEEEPQGGGSPFYEPSEPVETPDGLGVGDALRRPPRSQMALEDGHHLHPGRRKTQETREEATRESGLANLKDQLVKRAVQTARLKTKKQGKKKKEKASKGEKAIRSLTSALQQIISGNKSSSSKKEKRKHKRRRVTRPDGTIESYSMSSSDSSSSGKEEGDSDTDLEAPMRKKSLKKPGSVLSLLTSHVRETLEQGATTSVGDEPNSMTSGVKILTYFMLHLKPLFANHLRELRELYHLAATMDTLRQGDLNRTGDALAARFMAVHQSLIDSNWTTARHMEIHSMDETSAAGTSMVLATRRHTRLVAKAQGLTSSSPWYPRGRGKGGRAEWTPSEGKGDAKGDRGKGKKGKPKGRGKGAGWDWQGGGSDWKDKKEKPSEATT